MRRNSNDVLPLAGTSRCIPSITPPAGAVQCSSIFTPCASPLHEPDIHSGRVARKIIVFMGTRVRRRKRSVLYVPDKGLVHRVALELQLTGGDAGEVVKITDAMRVVEVRIGVAAKERVEAHETRIGLGSHAHTRFERALERPL